MLFSESRSLSAVCLRLYAVVAEALLEECEGFPSGGACAAREARKVLLARRGCAGGRGLAQRSIST